MPVRLIACVDGTCFDPDGLRNSYEGNTTNIYRLHSVVTVGDIGNNWVQRKRYWDGPGADAGTVTSLITGVFGTGVERMIKGVYQWCCREAPDPTDEIYLFGFSRGAYIIRAVAGIFHHLGAIKNDVDFDTAYATGIKLFRDLRWSGGSSRPAAIHRFFTNETRPAPTIRFLGAFDTVKALDDGWLYDITHSSSARRSYHALAMNEQRNRFTPELWTRSTMAESQVSVAGDKTYLQAWFIGAHADMGGANAYDGLSLYPLQWVLSAARDEGLVLGFEVAHDHGEVIENMLPLLFPAETPSLGNPYKGIMALENGIEVKMWDIRPAHTQSRYSIQINSSAFPRWIYKLEPRKLFSEGNLVGYEATGSSTFVHPSAYLLIDYYADVYINKRSWGFAHDLMIFRNKVIIDESTTFWETVSGVPSNLDELRILICGNNGTGKSTLINKIFGAEVTEVREDDHGRHDIDTPLQSTRRPGILIHDSCGFQVGLENGDASEIQKVKDFLRVRLSDTDIRERIHAIWYCVSINKPRLWETVDNDLFQAVIATKSKVPVILVVTKKDVLWNAVRSETLGDADDIDAVKILEARTAANKAVEERQQKFKEKFEQNTKLDFIGPILTSYKDETSIQNLLHETYRSFDNVRMRQILVATQICDVDLKVDQAITEGLTIFIGGAIASSFPVPWMSVGTQVTAGWLICDRMLRAFGYSQINTDVVYRIIKTSWLSNVSSNAIQFITGVAITYLLGPAAWATQGALAAFSVPKSARMMLMCITDVILILERAFWFQPGAIVTDESIRNATLEFERDKMGDVHKSVENSIRWYSLIKSFRRSSIEADLKNIIEKHRYKPID